MPSSPQHQQLHFPTSLEYDLGELLIFSESSSSLVFPYRGAHRFGRFPPPPARWPKATPSATTTTNHTNSSSVNNHIASYQHHFNHQQQQGYSTNNTIPNSAASYQTSTSQHNNNNSNTMMMKDPNLSFATEDVHWTIVSENAFYINAPTSTILTSSNPNGPNRLSPTLSPAMPPSAYNTNYNSFLNNNNNNYSSRSVSPNTLNQNLMNNNISSSDARVTPGALNATSGNHGLFPSFVDSSDQHNNNNPSSPHHQCTNINNNNQSLSIFYSNHRRYATTNTTGGNNNTDLLSVLNNQLLSDSSYLTSSAFLAQAGSSNSNPGSSVSQTAALMDKTLFILSIGVPHHRIDVGVALWFSNSALGVRSGSFASLVPYLLEFLQYALHDLGLTTSKYSSCSASASATSVVLPHQNQNYNNSASLSPPSQNYSYLNTPGSHQQQHGNNTKFNNPSFTPKSTTTNNSNIQQQNNNATTAGGGGGGNFPPLTCKTVSNNVMISPNAGEIYMNARTNLRERIKHASSLISRVEQQNTAHQQQKATTKETQSPTTTSVLPRGRRHGVSPPPASSSSILLNNNNNNFSAPFHHVYPVTLPRAVMRPLKEMLLHNRDESMKHSWEATKALLHLVQDVHGGGLHFGCSVIGYALALSRSSPIMRHNHQYFQNQQQQQAAMMAAAEFQHQQQQQPSAERSSMMNNNNNAAGGGGGATTAQHRNNPFTNPSTNHHHENPFAQHLSGNSGPSENSTGSYSSLPGGGGGSGTGHTASNTTGEDSSSSIGSTTSSRRGGFTPLTPNRSGRGFQTLSGSLNQQQNIYQQQSMEKVKGLSDLLSEALNFDLEHSTTMLPHLPQELKSFVKVDALLEAVQFYREHSGLARIVILSKRDGQVEDYNATCLFNVLRAVFRPSGRFAHSRDPFTGVFARKISDKDAARRGMLWGEAGWWAPLTHIEFSSSFGLSPMSAGDQQQPPPPTARQQQQQQQQTNNTPSSQVANNSIVLEENAFFRPKLLPALEFDHTCLIVDCMQKTMFLAAPSSGASPAANVMSCPENTPASELGGLISSSHPYVISALPSIPTFIDEVRTLCTAQAQEGGNNNNNNTTVPQQRSNNTAGVFNPFTHTLMGTPLHNTTTNTTNASFAAAASSAQHNNKANNTMFSSTGLKPGSADILRGLVDLTPALRSLAATECTQLFLRQNILGQSELAKKLIEAGITKKKQDVIPSETLEEVKNNTTNQHHPQQQDLLTDSPSSKKAPSSNTSTQRRNQGGLGLSRLQKQQEQKEQQQAQDSQYATVSITHDELAAVSETLTSSSSFSTLGRLRKAVAAIELQQAQKYMNEQPSLKNNNHNLLQQGGDAHSLDDRQQNHNGLISNNNSSHHKRTMSSSARDKLANSTNNNTNNKNIQQQLARNAAQQAASRLQQQREAELRENPMLTSLTVGFSSNDVMYALMI